MVYYIIYSKKLDSTIAIGQSEIMVNQYISQFNLRNEVSVFTKVLSNGLETSTLSMLELVYVSPKLILTKLELEYYNDYLRKLYDDIKTTISGLLLYSNMGSITSNQKTDLKQMAKMLYSKSSNYEAFIDGLDRSILFGKIISNPLTMQSVLYTHHDMKKRYKHLCDVD